MIMQHQHQQFIFAELYNISLEVNKYMASSGKKSKMLIVVKIG